MSSISPIHQAPNGGVRAFMKAAGLTLPLLIHLQHAYANVGDHPVRGVRRFESQQISMPATASGDVVIHTTIDGQPATIQLHPSTLRSRNFTVLAQGADGVVRTREVRGPRTFRGEAVQLPGSQVSASIRGGRIAARIALPDSSVWHIEPMHRFSATAAAGEHAVYRESDVMPTQAGCGATTSKIDAASALRAAAAASSPATAAAISKVCDIAFDADFEFFQANGSSVEATVDDIEEIINGVSRIYEEQANLTFEITTILVRTAEPDPYSSTNNLTLLNQFRTEWNVNRNGIHRDIAHLMTGKEIAGNVIGSAYNDTLCDVCGSADGYGFSQSHFTFNLAQRTCLTAHELGHNFGANHCDGEADCAIMCSVIGGCTGNCVEFNASALSAISLGISRAQCLATSAVAVELPFCDNVGSSIDSSLWPYSAIAAASASASNAPSPPYAFMLDGCCTPCGSAPDDLRSTAIRLGGLPNATLAYYTEFAGFASTAGSQLLVEFNNLDGDWTELNRITANGTTQSAFTLWTHSLPLDALHDDFRIRFRLGAAANAATWFVDDVSVTDRDIDDRVLRVHVAAAPGGDGSSWDSAFRNLQDAMTTASCSRGIVEEIWVGAGTYLPDQGTLNRQSSFELQNGVSILGGFTGFETYSEQRNPATNVTILSGDIGVISSSTDNVFHIVSSASVDRSAVLDGFTIRAGRANGASPHNVGAGLWNNAGSPTIRHCRFVSNSSTDGGGAFNSAGSDPLFEYCTFTANTASRSGGGIFNAPGSAAIVHQSRFFGNSAATGAGGGIFTSAGTVAIRDSIFSGNFGGSGGGVQTSNGSAEIINCSIVRNTALAFGGGVVNNGSTTLINSSILWGNSDPGGADESGQIHGLPPFIDYSILQGWTGGFGGAGNSGIDPVLVDADGPDNFVGNDDDDLRPQLASPAVDRGDPVVTFIAGEVDLAGNVRVLCGRLDIGAFESAAGDFDCNARLNLADFSHWDMCMNGPAAATLPDGCEAFDLDADSDVDLRDYSRWSTLRSGV